MKLSKKQKKELLDKINQCHKIAKECYKKYGGNKYAFLAGVYQGVLSEILDDFNLFNDDSYIDF